VDWRRSDTIESDHTYIYSNGRVYKGFQSRFSVETTYEDDGQRLYTLVIEDVQQNDSSFYWCIEDAGFGERHLFYLIVTGLVHAIVTDICA